jgi:hypothetical protein
MKNIFKSRFSLIAICIVLGILIGSFALCGCKTNYGLLEGMIPEVNVEQRKEATTDSSLSGASGDASSKPADLMQTQPVGVGDIVGGLSNIGASINTSDGNAITSSIAAALQTTNPLAGIMKTEVKEEEEEEESKQVVKDAFTVKKKEGFQMSRPLAFGPIKGNESDDVELSKWVSDAMRYSKGMGNENRLDSYQYNTGPPIPLPEGELFFFKDTKFDSSCCPSTYTNSMGCACMSKKQFQHLTMRGGNNTIPKTKTAYYNDF